VHVLGVRTDKPREAADRGVGRGAATVPTAAGPVVEELLDVGVGQHRRVAGRLGAGRGPQAGAVRRQRLGPAGAGGAAAPQLIADVGVVTIAVGDLRVVVRPARPVARQEAGAPTTTARGR